MKTYGGFRIVIVFGISRKYTARATIVDILKDKQAFNLFQ